MSTTGSYRHLQRTVMEPSTEMEFGYHSGSLSFFAVVPNVADCEIDAFRRGSARLGVFTHGRFVGLVLCIDGFLNRSWMAGVCAWVDGANGPHQVSAGDRYAAHLEVTLNLIDEDGVLRAIRRAALSADATKRLLECCRKANAAGPLDDAEAKRGMDELLDRYPTPRDAYWGSLARCRLEA